MAKSLNFPLKKVFVVDGSKRSGHSNAYQFGFGNNKRIVIYDTLLGINDEKESEKTTEGEPAKDEKENAKDAGVISKKVKLSNKEIMSILWHELGHWYYGHIYKLLGW